MNTHVLDPHTDAELRSLDAASDVVINADRRDAALNSILTTPTASTDAVTSLAPAKPRRHIGRWAAAGAVAAAATGVAIALPTITAAPSYASWTAQPATVSPSDSALVREACLAPLASSNNSVPLSGLDGRDVRLAERRGDYVTMILSQRSTDGTTTSVLCQAKLASGSSKVSDVNSGVTGEVGRPAPEAREFTQDSIAQLADNGGALMTEGEVGKDVAKLTLHAGGKTVDATISNGAYAAWWPGKLLPMGETSPPPAITYDVTYADGTIERDVAPTVPGGSGEIHTETPSTS